MCVRRPCRQVERARPERGEADPRPAGQPTVGRRHERGGLFMAGQDELDARLPQRLDNVEVLLARNAEDVFDALVLQGSDKQVRSLGHQRRPRSEPRH